MLSSVRPIYTNYVVESGVPTIVLYRVIRKDVVNLYKQQTFRPRGLLQSQVSHVDDNATIIHDIDRVYLDIIMV